MKSQLIFYKPHKDFGAEGEGSLNLMINHMINPELELKLVGVSSDEVDVHQVWKERRLVGGSGSCWHHEETREPTHLLDL